MTYLKKPRLEKSLITFKYLILRISKINRNKRKLILLTLDGFMIFISLLLSNWIIFNNPITIINFSSINIISSIFLGLIIYYFSGQYKSLSRFITSSLIYKISARNLLFIIIIFLNNLIFFKQIISIKLIFLIWIILVTLTSSPRFIVRDFLEKIYAKDIKNLKKIAIYGASSYGAQLYKSLKINGDNEITFFIDDNKNLKGRYVDGIEIRSFNELEKIKNNIDTLYIANRKINKSRIQLILEECNKFNISVMRIPSAHEIASGKLKINNLRRISPDDLLGRKAVSADPKLLGPGIFSEIICVTGCAGSIGSEISRQLIKLSPKKLILVDNSEANLYNLEQELSILNTEKIEIKFILLDVTKENSVKKLFLREKINVIFHAAAYKHVPLLEKNPISGIFNNVFSTYVLANVVRDLSLKKFILISSDKAVRPSNVMGASKRFSELIIQSFAEEMKTGKSVFSMVRFGNVLGSSGSVVPLFTKQIENGGPITITHKDMVRYFMTIPEAAQLVIQASALAEGGEVFLLDMGEPVKIYDLAKQMILINGLSLKDKNNSDGDIEITISGIRPGEKLFEELLITSKSIPTRHPLIFKGNEKKIPFRELNKYIQELEYFLQNEDLKSSLSILKKVIPEWLVNQ